MRDHPGTRGGLRVGSVAARTPRVLEPFGCIACGRYGIRALSLAPTPLGVGGVRVSFETFELLLQIGDALAQLIRALECLGKGGLRSREDSIGFRSAAFGLADGELRRFARAPLGEVVA